MLGIIGYGRIGKRLVSSVDCPVLIKARNCVSEDILLARSHEEITRRCDNLIMSIRGTNLPEIQPHYANFTGRIISPMSSVTVRQLEDMFPHARSIVRIMPNIFCDQLSSNLPFLCQSEEDREAIPQIFSRLQTIPIYYERDMDKITMINSVTPALIAFMIKELTAHGKRVTMGYKDAEYMVLHVVKSTISEIIWEGITPEQIIKEVATPGGITEKCIDILEKSKFLNVKTK